MSLIFFIKSLPAGPDFDNINEYYDLLTYKTKNHEYVGIINEWLIDNFYLLVEHKTNFLEDKAKLKKKLKFKKVVQFLII